MTISERQLLVRRALELDDPTLSPEDEALVESRLAEHHRNPASAISLGDMKARFRSGFAKLNGGLNFRGGETRRYAGPELGAAIEPLL